MSQGNSLLFQILFEVFHFVGFAVSVTWCRLHGNVESLGVLPNGAADGGRRRDSIILTFRDAKISVLEFDDSIHGLRTRWDIILLLQLCSKPVVGNAAHSVLLLYRCHPYAFRSSSLYCFWC